MAGGGTDGARVLWDYGQSGEESFNPKMASCSRELGQQGLRHPRLSKRKEMRMDTRTMWAEWVDGRTVERKEGGVTEIRIRNKPTRVIPKTPG